MQRQGHRAEHKALLPEWEGSFITVFLKPVSGEHRVRECEESWDCPLRGLVWPHDLFEPQLSHLQNSDNDDFCSSSLLEGSNTLNSCSQPVLTKQLPYSDTVPGLGNIAMKITKFLSPRELTFYI